MSTEEEIVCEEICELISGPFEKLNKEQKKQVRAIYIVKCDGLLRAKDGATISYTSLRHFKPMISRNAEVTDSWVGYQIMNFYLTLIKERSQIESSLPKMMFFPSCFTTKMLENVHGRMEAMAKWRKNDKVFSHDLVMFVIQKDENHWTLAVANSRTKKLSYYDSFHKPVDGNALAFSFISI
jgi:Ulp1 family protease